MKSLKEIITCNIVLISVVMSVLAFGALFVVIYYFYSDHDTSIFKLLLPAAVILAVQIF